MSSYTYIGPRTTCIYSDDMHKLAGHRKLYTLVSHGYWSFTHFSVSLSPSQHLLSCSHTWLRSTNLRYRGQRYVMSACIYCLETSVSQTLLFHRSFPLLWLSPSFASSFVVLQETISSKWNWLTSIDIKVSVYDTIINDVELNSDFTLKIIKSDCLYLERNNNSGFVFFLS